MKNTVKQPSEAALCAKAIRAELKNTFPQIKFAVKSSNFAGGNSVDIDWIDGPTIEQVEVITSKYQYGKFDSMTDYYEDSNSRSDIPQAKYIMENRSISD